MVWAFFEDGLYRAYPLSKKTHVEDGPDTRFEDVPDGIPEGEAGRRPSFLPADLPEGKAGRLPFEWTPRFACTDAKDGLWVVGISGGRIVVARLAEDAASTWETSFPAGPQITGHSPERPARGPGESVAVAGKVSLRNGIEIEQLSEDNDGGLPDKGVIVRAHAARELYVFWHVRAAARDGAERIRGARLHHSHRDPTLPGAWWKDLPRLQTPALSRVDDFCVAPADGEVGIVARCRVPRLTRWIRERMFHARLVSKGDGDKKDENEWTSPEAIPGTSEAFRFGQIAGTSWARWGAGGLLLTSNTQRVRAIEYGGGEWRPYAPAPWFVTYLPEIQVTALMASALLLVVTGCGVFGARLSRLRKGVPFSHTMATEERPVPAPLLARIFAGVLDLMLVSGLVVMIIGLLPGASDPPSVPLLPGLAPLARQIIVLAGLVAYGTAMEATLGATLGKMALGLRVVRLPVLEREAGGAASGRDGRSDVEPEVNIGFGRALVRNLFRFVDTGAVGVAVIMITNVVPATGTRRRFGDMAAGTIVVVDRGRAAARDARAT